MNKSAIACDELLVVRSVGLDDLPALTCIYNQGIRTANANEHKVDIVNRTAWFAKHDETCPIIGVYLNERLIAWSSLSEFHPLPAYKITREISIYVDRAFIGQGLGKLLLEHMLKIAKELGVINVVALVFSDNIASIKLFEKFGFGCWGVWQQVCRFNHNGKDEFKDVTVLAKSMV
ncbi:N-acetyltransferase family protein [Moraxella nasovis]|uniref:GNAT family N-acetyltransferase n=1 Tax=Moraxella nasovis TaxID=2904121 RepID=UPI001F610382|nr:GNAT family N-acetyltransferase [Moraxella nasovis]UNU73618.1 N-acetyltransferase family protein [Moraxella nasovis]